MTPLNGYSRQMSAPRKRIRLVWAFVALVALVAFALVVGFRVSHKGPVRPAPPAVTPAPPRLPAPGPRTAWLGLDYNSDAKAGSLTDFAVRGIVYDREGTVGADAGDTLENHPDLASGLATAYRAHMIPDIEVEPVDGPPGCTSNPSPANLCLPTGRAQVSSYVQGFLQTASSVVHRYPHKRVLFEPTNEPWTWAFPPGTAPGKAAATEYALILAQLLPAARAAKVPLNDIYVPATGTLSDGSSWIRDLYEAQPCLKPGPSSCGPIAGWNLHPYGLPHSLTEGIDSVPAVRAQMLSGQDNVVIGEIGFCANDVDEGNGCQLNLPDLVGSSTQAAAWLRETLNEAAPMHQAGWLKALLVWERLGTGWAMQNADGTLTAQGRVLDLFADSAKGR
jgi:hypothetical protein